MPVVLTFSDGVGNFPRSYIKGFYTDDDYPIVGISTDLLQLTQTGFDVLVNLVIRTNFYAPSSNVYSLDYVFDAAASQAYYLGVPYLAGFDIKLIGDPIDFSWRIKVVGSGSSGPPSRAALLPMGVDYWLPR